VATMPRPIRCPHCGAAPGKDHASDCPVIQKPVRKPSTLAKDLSEHFRNRLECLIDDHLDTCERVDIATSDSAALMLSTLITAAVSASRWFNVPEDQFVRVCNETFRELQKYETRMRRGRIA
jgi:hypothetical protein